MKSSGILMLGVIPMKHILAVSTTKLPIVLVDSPYSNLKYDHVLANNYQGTYEATELLLNHGHTHIGFVGSASYSFSFRERVRGFQDCILERQNDTLKSFCITEKHDSFFIPFSREQFRQVMRSSERPTALVCANDITAFLVYELLNEFNLKVPEDVSVIGFDNVPKSEWINPSLTTVNVPKTTMGQRAVDLLLKRIENPDHCFEQVLLGTNIIRRNSVTQLK